MNSLSCVRCFLSRWARLLPLLCLLSPVTRAQNPATGILEGRVFNPGTGEYLEFVRVTMEGTALETFTDQLGEYRFAGPNTPEVAQLRSRNQFGAQWTFGLKGTF